MVTTPTRTSDHRPTTVAVLGLLAGLAIFASVLSSVEGDASALLRVGEENERIISFVEEQLDHVRVVANLGHDGKYYFVHAHDPFLLDPDTYARIIDRPVYRTQRILYPLLASVGGLLQGWAVAWGLIVVNLMAMALGTWATAKLAVSLGTSAWWGLAFALNPGVIFELIIDGAGTLAWALAVLGVWLLVEGKYRGAVVAVVAAVLAREAMILVAAGLTIGLWKQDRTKAIAMAVWPSLAALLWALWVRWRLGVPVLTSESEEIGVPFAGLVSAATRWLEEPGRNLVLGLVVIALLLVATMQVIRRPSLVAYSTIGFVVLAPLLTRQVWLNYFDITRAIAPLFTTYVLVLFARDPALGIEGPVHKNVKVLEE